MINSEKLQRGYCILKIINVFYNQDRNQHQRSIKSVISSVSSIGIWAEDAIGPDNNVDA